MAAATYLLGVGSNRRGRHGSPAAEVRAAIAALPRVVAASPVIDTAPLGPSLRRFANAAVLVESALPPPGMLALVQAVERRFGRRRGRRWAARVIDIDIVLWSGGCWSSAGLTVPHPAFRSRRFVLAPAAAIAPDCRDPMSGRTVRQLLALVDRPRPRP